MVKKRKRLSKWKCHYTFSALSLQIYVCVYIYIDGNIYIERDMYMSTNDQVYTRCIQDVYFTISTHINNPELYGYFKSSKVLTFKN